MRLKSFFSDRDVRRIAIFNIAFLYIWGYLLFGPTEVGTKGWAFEECGHLLWSWFHTVVLISYTKRHAGPVFEIQRETQERGIWLIVVLLSVFVWEGFELLRDLSGLFTTLMQLGNTDTMVDIFLSGCIGPWLGVWFWRWKDGVGLFLTDPNITDANEYDLAIAYAALRRIADRNTGNHAETARVLRNLIKEEWRNSNHHILPVVKIVYGIVRGSRRERRRRSWKPSTVPQK